MICRFYNVKLWGGEGRGTLATKWMFFFSTCFMANKVEIIGKMFCSMFPYT